VRKSELKGNRAAHEDEVLARFFEVAPPPSEIKITVLADRGFADWLMGSLSDRRVDTFPQS
jgi:hypothetical protein